MNIVTQAIIENGQFTGIIRGYNRYGIFSNKPIGYRISPDGSRILLYQDEYEPIKGRLLAAELAA